MRAEHFRTVETWNEAAALVDFAPRTLSEIAGRPLVKLEVYVRDLQRDLPISDRIVEARYSGLAFAQSRKDPAEARRCALEVRYGHNAQPVTIHGHEGRMYELGPEVPPDDIDGRNASVIAWADSGMFYFLASSELPLAELLPIARSLYRQHT